VTVAGKGLVVRDLTYTVPGRTILADVSFHVPAGSIAGLVGPNGAGKTTLLRAVVGAVGNRLGGGSIAFDGAPLGPPGSRARARTVGLVEPTGLAAPLRVGEVVALGRFPHRSQFGAPTDRDRAAVCGALERAGVGHLEDRRLSTLSDGERQRVLIARALAQNPRLLLLDEPTSHLDLGAASRVAAIVRQIAADGVAVVAALHDLTMAAGLCEQIVVLDDGRVVAAGPPRDVLTRELVEAVYRVRCEVFENPATGTRVFALG
jgi:iron complex transport system ATP-binding protein